MLAMLQLGLQKQRVVKAVKTIGGKRCLVTLLHKDGTPVTQTVAHKVARVTKGVLNGHFCRDSGRRLVVSLLAGDVLELRPQGTRQAVTATLFDVYAWMLRSKADQIKMAKLRERKARLAERRRERALRRPIRA